MQIEKVQQLPVIASSAPRVSRAARRRVGSYLPYVYSVLGALLAWWLLAALLPSQFILATPLQTFTVLGGLLRKPDTYPHIGLTLMRLFIGFFIAEFLGLILGTLMGLRQYFERIFNLWVVIGLTIPSLVWAIIALMIFGLSEAGVIVAIAITSFPVITVNIWGGVKSINTKLLDMAKVFRLSRADILLRVILPQILPYIFSSSRYGIGICWKIAVVVEMLGSSNGVGYQFAYWFGLLSMSHVFAWTFILVVIMTVIEFGVIRVLERRVLAWRPQINF